MSKRAASTRAAVVMMMIGVFGLTPPTLPAEDAAASAVMDILGDGGELESSNPAAVEEAINQSLDEDALDAGMGGVVGVGAALNGPGNLGTKLTGVYAAFDRDGDGKLGPEERGDALLQIKNDRLMGVERRLSKDADANGDGTLDDAERAKLDALLTDHQSKCDIAKARLLARWDKDGDGKLDRAERTNLKKACDEKKAKAGDKGKEQAGEDGDDDDESGDGDQHGKGKGKGKAKGHEKHKDKGKGKDKD